MSAKTTAGMVAGTARRREREDNTPDAPNGFRPVGTHTVVVIPPYCSPEAFGGGNLTVELTPGHDLPFHLRQLVIAIGNARITARMDRFDVPGAINS